MEGTVEIAVPMLSRIANFDDFDPLAQEPSVRLTMIPPGKPIPASAALIILPGTKATIADLEFLRAQGWDIDIAAHVRRGGHVLRQDSRRVGKEGVSECRARWSPA